MAISTHLNPGATVTDDPLKSPRPLMIQTEPARLTNPSVNALPPRKHRWDYEHERRIAGTEFPDGNARTERDCLHCKITKVTVHPPSGFAWREWISPKSPGQRFTCTSTPPCIAET